jgi:hypothetical protein
MSDVLVQAVKPNAQYFLGVEPERVQEKKYGYAFPETEGDDVQVRRAPPSSSQGLRVRPQQLLQLNIADAKTSSQVAPAPVTAIVCALGME